MLIDARDLMLPAASAYRMDFIALLHRQDLCCALSIDSGVSCSRFKLNWENVSKNERLTSAGG